MKHIERMEIIRDTALADGMPGKLADLIAAQAAHETGWFSSNAFNQNNNLFGYKFVPGAKWQSGAGRTSTEGDPYAKYDSIENSIHELTAWIGRRQKNGIFPDDLSQIDTPEKYAHLLKKAGYYGAPEAEYIAGLKRGIGVIGSSNSSL